MRPFVFLAAAAFGGTLPAASPHAFDWMSGEWCTAVERGTRTCESWAGGPDEAMQGRGWTTKAGRIVETEETRIGLAGGKAYYDAAPGGGRTVRFAEIARGTRDITFENRGHDYPQRIRYWREGDALLAEISLADGSRKMRWLYARQPAEARPLR